MALASFAAAQTGPLVNGVAESYFQSESGKRGFQNQVWWGELDYHPSSYVDFTGSYLLSGTYHSWDELYMKVHWDLGSVQIGRMRTHYGFNTWADYYYTGFNQFPIVRMIPLVDNLRLLRDDSGVEASTNIGDTTIWASAIQPGPPSDEIAPQEVNTSTARVQHAFGSLIAGGDFLSPWKGDEKIYGVDARYTFPQVLMRGEAFWGVGDDASNGFYVDAQYRLPKLYRTQIVGRYDSVNLYDQGSGHLTTLGVRQIFNKYANLNANYVYGTHLPYGGYSNAGPFRGWSARLMFSLPFKF
jgi:hypothetical protein